MPRRQHPPGLGLVVVLIGALVAAGEGLSNLECAPLTAILITVAGSFGAGAAFAAFIAQWRARRATAGEAP